MVGYWGHTARQVPSEPRERRPRPKPPPNGPATTGPGRSRSAPSLYEGLVVEERRRAANDRGRRLGDDEEAALLESALRESLAEGPQSPPAPIELPKPAPARADDSDDDDAGDAPSTEFVLADERRIEQTSLLLALPLEVAAKCLAFATVEGAMRGAAACRDWSRACWDASLCEALARRVWQSRVSGAYSMRQTRSKLVKQDMFTATELKGTFWVEVAWSRYFRFFENGAVLYSLQNEDGSPGSVLKELLHQKHLAGPKKGQQHSRHKVERCFAGNYVLDKKTVTVRVRLPHAFMIFEMRVEHGKRGHFNRLRLLRHTQLAHNDPTPVEHARAKHDEVLDFRSVREWA